MILVFFELRNILRMCKIKGVGGKASESGTVGGGAALVVYMSASCSWLFTV